MSFVLVLYGMVLPMANFRQALRPEPSHASAVQGGPGEAARLVHRVMDRDSEECWIIGKEWIAFSGIYFLMRLDGVSFLGGERTAFS